LQRTIVAGFALPELSGKSMDDVSQASRKVLESGLASASAMSEKLGVITTEAGEFARETAQRNSSLIEAITSAGTPETALRLQTDFARESYRAMVSQAARMTELYAELARDVYRPFETTLWRGR
jgi:hypothetical protein